jgi:hypothetical protein
LGVNVPDRLTEERIAKNDDTFREANERIEAVVEEHDLTDRPVPFICECADVRCTQVTRLLLDEYRHVRSDPRWFLNVPGHEVAAMGAAVVIERHDTYVVVEKQGHAGEVAEELADKPAEVETA